MTTYKVQKYIDRTGELRDYGRKGDTVKKQ